MAPDGASEPDRMGTAIGREREKGSSPMTAVVARVQDWWQSTLQFLREVRVELKKVTWPSRAEVIGSTAVVIVASFLFAFFLGAVDLVLQRLLGLVLR